MRGETYKGTPCIHGHDGTRYVSNRTCVECAYIRGDAAYQRRFIEAIGKSTTYHGAVCKTNPKHGTKRYRTSHSCVICRKASALASTRAKRLQNGVQR
jgi:hypothetical protein